MAKQYDIDLVNKVRDLSNQGYGSRMIGKTLEVSRDVVRAIQGRYNIETVNAYRKPIDVKLKVRERTNNRFRYVRGFQTVDKNMVIVCNKCDTERIANAQFLRRNKIIKCYNCDEKNRAIKQELKSKEAFKLKIKRYITASGIKLKIFANTCNYCGHKSIDNKKKNHCSSRCMKRANELSKSDARRERIESNGYKENITLPKLFKRDKGICHICKGKCDYNDYEIKGNVFYAKDNYPSRDHVIPLSKGGTHTWDNIKLAHMRCNTVKNNNTSIVIDRGRIRLDL